MGVVKCLEYLILPHGIACWHLLRVVGSKQTMVRHRLGACVKMTRLRSR